MRRQTVIYYFAYRTAVGTVWLMPEPQGRYGVVFKDEHLGSYASPEMAVDDVAGGHTFTPSNGIDFAHLGIPDELGEWKRKPFMSYGHLRASSESR